LLVFPLDFRGTQRFHGGLTGLRRLLSIDNSKTEFAIMNQLNPQLATHTSDNIFAAIELSSTVWVIALYLPIKNKISLARVTSGDVDRLLEILERARTTTRAEGGTDPRVHTCYEAGYDGFWLHRLLSSKGIHNRVLDSASISVRSCRLRCSATTARSSFQQT
jgi:hypothetical protein